MNAPSINNLTILTFILLHPKTTYQQNLVFTIVTNILDLFILDVSVH